MALDHTQPKIPDLGLMHEIICEILCLNNEALPRGTKNFSPKNLEVNSDKLCSLVTTDSTIYRMKNQICNRFSTQCQNANAMKATNISLPTCKFVCKFHDLKTHMQGVPKKRCSAFKCLFSFKSIFIQISLDRLNMKFKRASHKLQFCPLTDRDLEFLKLR